MPQIAPRHWHGRNFTDEDFALEESMGPIVDRTRAYIGTSDAAVVRERRMLLEALRRHADGALSFGRPSAYGAVTM